MNITLHIGSVKTGTSTIQSFMAQNRAWFEDQGWFIPQALKPRPSFDNQIVLPALFCDERFRTAQRAIAGQRHSESDADFDIRVANRLDKEIQQARAAGSRAMLISSEHLVSRMHEPQRVPAMRQWLEQFGRVEHIVVYLRRQDELFPSLYSTQVKSGSSEKFEWNRPPRRHRSFNHKVMLEPWLDTFADVRFSVRPYESDRFENGNLIDDFLHLLGVTKGRPPDPPKKNLSLDPEALAVLRVFNGLAGKIVQPRKIRNIRAIMIRILSAGDNGERLSLSEEEARMMLAAFADGNRWLSERFTQDDRPFFENGIATNQEHRGLPRVGFLRFVRRVCRGMLYFYVR